MGAMAQERVLTTGGVTRLVGSTKLREGTVVQTGRVHAENVRRHFLAPLPRLC